LKLCETSCESEEKTVSYLDLMLNGLPNLRYVVPVAIRVLCCRDHIDVGDAYICSDADADVDVDVG